MIFEFIIVHQPQEVEPILGILRERLREALETNLNDVEDDALARMVRTTFERAQPAGADGTPRAVLGFSLELPDDTASIRDVVDEFADALMADPIAHAVKCEDPLLRAELVLRAEELFALEMKLRRVLSIIYLHAYPDADPYDLLTEEAVQPMTKEKLVAVQMKAAAENQFFHLTFGQYVSLNQRPAIKDLVSLIRNQDTYEAIRAELLRQPVEHEDDAGFLAGLKERIDAIEKMRNAVAHNRRPTKKTNEAYLNVLPLVKQALDNYLGNLEADWPASLETDEMLWDEAARAAVERAMEFSEWDEITKTIKLHQPHEGRARTSVSSRDQLVSYLEAEASSAYYANCPRDDGEFVFACDENDVVEAALHDIEEKLSEFFSQADESDGSTE